MRGCIHIIMALLCLLLSSCAAGVRHHYPPSIANLSRSELVRLDSAYYPFIEAIDAARIGPYLSPLYITPGEHTITVRPRKESYEADPVTVTLNAGPGEVYELSYAVKWDGKDKRSGVLSAGAERTGFSEPPPHPLIMRRNGLVYIYREHKVFGPGTDVTFPVYLNGRPLQNLYPGSLCPVIIRPGAAAFSLPVGSAQAVLDIEPGIVYYLKGGISMGGVSLVQVDERDGGREIRKAWLNALCHEVPRGYYPFVTDGR